MAGRVVERQPADRAVRLGEQQVGPGLDAHRRSLTGRSGTSQHARVMGVSRNRRRRSRAAARPRRARPDDRPRRADRRALPRRLGRSRAAHRARGDPGGQLLTDHENSDYLNLHRSKGLIQLDLARRRPTAASSSASSSTPTSIVENNRAPVKAKLGIDYEARRRRQPAHRVRQHLRLRPGRPGQRQGRRRPDHPGRRRADEHHRPARAGAPCASGIAVSDSAAGHQLALGIMIALYDRQRTGRGQWVKVSLLEAMISFLDFQAVRYTIDGRVPETEGNHHPTARPMGTYRAADGHLNIAAPGERFWDRLCDVLEDDELRGRRALRDAAARATTTATSSTTRSTSASARAPATSGSPCSTRWGSRAVRSTRWTRCSPTRRCSTWRCWRRSTTRPRGPGRRPAQPDHDVAQRTRRADRRADARCRPGRRARRARDPAGRLISPPGAGAAASSRRGASWSRGAAAARRATASSAGAAAAGGSMAEATRSARRSIAGLPVAQLRAPLRRRRP